jgi:hypothetical protein
LSSRKRGRKQKAGNKPISNKLSLYSRPWQPKFPTHLALQLNGAGSAQLSGIAGPAYYSFGIMEFLAGAPQWITQMYDIYRYAVVTGIEIEAEFVNLSTTAITQLAVGTAPYVDLPLSFDSFLQLPGTTRKVQSIAAGTSRSTITKRFSAFAEMAAPYFNKDYWVTSTQAASPTPIDTSFPVGLIGVAGPTGADFVTGSLQWRVKYHCVFFDFKPNT